LSIVKFGVVCWARKIIARGCDEVLEAVACRGVIDGRDRV